LLAQLTTRELYDRITPLVDSAGTIGETTVAVCLPPAEFVRAAATQGLSQAMRNMSERGIRYKVIPEATLISEWDGLDTLVVCSKGLGPQGLRKLHGFCAAGGVVAAVGAPLGVAHELPFDNWLFTVQ
jgi:hypothetical protein